LHERLAFEVIAIDDDLLMACQCLANGFGMDVGIAVHVAADPRPETYDLWDLDVISFVAILRNEGGLNLFVKDRDDLVEDLGDEEQHVLSFFRHREALARVFSGLPPGRDLRADALPDLAGLRRMRRQAHATQEQLRDLALLAKNRSARRLRRMRRKNRLDPHLEQQLPHVLEAESMRLELLDRLDQPARLFEPLVQVLPAPADAMHLFGSVDHLEPNRESPYQIARLGRRGVADALCQQLGAMRVSLSPRDRRSAIRFHRREQRLAPLLANHLADEHTEHVHVLAQLGVLRREADISAGHGSGTCSRGDKLAASRPRVALARISLEEADMRGGLRH